MEWQGERHLFRHDHTCSTLFMDGMGFCTRAGRRGCSNTIVAHAQPVRIRAMSGCLTWKKSSLGENHMDFAQTRRPPRLSEDDRNMAGILIRRARSENASWTTS